MIDQLIGAILAKNNNPTAVGIDTDFGYLPEEMKKNCRTREDAAHAILDFNRRLLDAVAPIVPAVKVQVAYYESYGIAGLEVFQKTLEYASSLGLVTIADVKRNDIGATAAAYSRAFFSGLDIGGEKLPAAFYSDFVTVNGYLGTDGVLPFVKDFAGGKHGIFVLVKTSNPSSSELQNLALADGRTVYAAMADRVEDWGKDSVGAFGFSDVGAVVGATHPAEAAELRERMPHTFFLIPGYGAQGGTAEDLRVCFDRRHLGGIVNSSRGILCAYKAEKYKGMFFDAAAYAACVDMAEDLRFR